MTLVLECIQLFVLAWSTSVVVNRDQLERTTPVIFLQGGKARGKCFYVRNDSWRLAGQYLQGEKARG